MRGYGETECIIRIVLKTAAKTANSYRTQAASNTGDKVTYNSKHYISTIDNNVWSPDAYPQGWSEVA